MLQPRHTVFHVTTEHLDSFFRRYRTKEHLVLEGSKARKDFDQGIVFSSCKKLPWNGKEEMQEGDMAEIEVLNGYLVFEVAGPKDPQRGNKVERVKSLKSHPGYVAVS